MNFLAVGSCSRFSIRVAPVSWTGPFRRMCTSLSMTLRPRAPPLPGWIHARSWRGVPPPAPVSPSFHGTHVHGALPSMDTLFCFSGSGSCPSVHDGEARDHWMGSITWKRVHAIPFPPTRGLRRVARRAGMDGACARRLWTKEEIEGDTPSRKEGVPSAVEALCRRAACQLVIDTGARLKLPQPTVATCIVYYQEFFARQSLREYDHRDMALTCLFLACKVEETPRSLVDVINVGYALAYRKHPDKVQQLSDKAYFQKHVEKVTRAEGVLLHTLQFELEVDKPYPYMEKLSKCLPLDMPEDVKINLLQLAWDHVNNSYKTTTVCMQYPAGDIASACTHFAAALLHVLPILGPEDGREFFWNTFGTSRKVRDEIMSQLLLVYE